MEAVLGAAITAAAALAVVIVTRSAEHRRWLRQERLAASSNLLGVALELDHVLMKLRELLDIADDGVPDSRGAELRAKISDTADDRVRLLQEIEQALARVELLGPTAVSQPARALLVASLEHDGDEATNNNRDRLQARMTFVAAMQRVLRSG